MPSYSDPITPTFCCLLKNHITWLSNEPAVSNSYQYRLKLERLQAKYFPYKYLMSDIPNLHPDAHWKYGLKDQLTYYFPVSWMKFHWYHRRFLDDCLDGYFIEVIANAFETNYPLFYSPKRFIYYLETLSQYGIAYMNSCPKGYDNICLVYFSRREHFYNLIRALLDRSKLILEIVSLGRKYRDISFNERELIMLQNLKRNVVQFDQFFRKRYHYNINSRKRIIKYFLRHEKNPKDYFQKKYQEYIPILARNGINIGIFYHSVFFYLYHYFRLYGHFEWEYISENRITLCCFHEIIQDKVFLFTDIGDKIKLIFLCTLDEEETLINSEVVQLFLAYVQRMRFSYTTVRRKTFHEFHLAIPTVSKSFITDGISLITPCRDLTCYDINHSDKKIVRDLRICNVFQDELKKVDSPLFFIKKR